MAQRVGLVPTGTNTAGAAAARRVGPELGSLGRALVVAGVAFAASSGGPADAQEIAREMFARGVEAEDAGKPSEAAKHYESAAAGGIPAAYGRLGKLASDRGSHGAAADWYEKGAAQCDGQSQLGLSVTYRMGRGREADGNLAYAWLIAAERAKADWSDSELAELATLERDIPAYMSAERVATAYCRGLDLYIEACGGTHLLARLERWVYCE